MSEIQTLLLESEAHTMRCYGLGTKKTTDSGRQQGTPQTQQK